jgi:hypothetical protein
MEYWLLSQKHHFLVDLTGIWFGLPIVVESLLKADSCFSTLCNRQLIVSATAQGHKMAMVTCDKVKKEAWMTFRQKM